MFCVLQQHCGLICRKTKLSCHRSRSLSQQGISGLECLTWEVVWVALLVSYLLLPEVRWPKETLEERVSVACTSRSQLIAEGNQGKKSSRDWSRTVEGHCSLASNCSWSADFFCNSDHLLRGGATHRELGPAISVNAKRQCFRDCLVATATLT